MAVALVVGDAGNLSTADQALISYLEGEGLTVDTYSQTTARPDNDGSSNPYEGYVIAESVSSGTAESNGWAEPSLSVPVLTVEIGTWDVLMLSTGSGTDENSDNITILDNTHDITSGFATSALTIYSSTGRIGAHDLDVDIEAGAALAERTAGITRPAIMQVDTGDARGDGSASPARRVLIGFYDAQLLNTDGETIFQRAIRWTFDLQADASVTVTAPVGAASVAGLSATVPESQELTQGHYARVGGGYYTRVGGGQYARLVSGLTVRLGTVTASGVTASVSTTGHVTLAAPVGAATFAGRDASVVLPGSVAVTAMPGAVTVAGLTATAAGQQDVTVDVFNALAVDVDGPAPFALASSNVHVVTFESDAVGAGLPSGWTARWETANDSWSIVDEGGDPGRVLQHTATVSGRRLASLDAATGYADVEIFALARSLNANFDDEARLYVRAGGAAGNEHAYLLELGGEGGDLVQMEGYEAGNEFVLASATFDWAVDVWYGMRLRVEGNRLRGRVWQPTDLGNPTASEPSTWLIDVTDTRVVGGGWTGVGTYQEDADDQFAYVRIEGLSTDAVVGAPDGSLQAAGLQASVEAFGPVVLAAPLGAATVTGLQPRAQSATSRTIWDDGDTLWDDGVTVWDVNTNAAPVGTATFAGITAAVLLSETPSAQGVYARTGGGRYRRVPNGGFYARVTTSVNAPVGASSVQGLTASVQATGHRVLVASVGTATFGSETAGVTTGGAQIVLPPRGLLTWIGRMGSVPLTTAPAGAVSAGGLAAAVVIPGERVVRPPRKQVLLVALQPRAMPGANVTDVSVGQVTVAALTPSVSVFLSLEPEVVAPRGSAFVNAFGADHAYPSLTHREASLWRTVRAHRRSRRVLA